MTDELNEITFCDECPYSGEPNGCNRKEGVCRAHDYCFDLRDERDALKSENAELRARLDKAVELPCKVGDIVYTVWCDAFAAGIHKIKINEKNIYQICDSISIGWTFLTREAAEAKLKEVRG